MIIVLHSDEKVVEILDENFRELSQYQKTSISETVFNLAKANPKTLIVWCHKDYKNYINIEKFQAIFHHNCMMVSYSKREEPFMSSSIGFVDHSIHIKTNRNKRYPTWLMHSDIGGVNSEVLNLLDINFTAYTNFEYLLNSISKACMQKGLFCYSDPNLLKENAPKLNTYNTISTKQLFQFVKSNYKSVWQYILFISLLIFKKKCYVFSLMKGMFFKSKTFKTDLSSIQIQIQTTKSLIKEKTVDVIIPTIGRKNYLFDVLKDLSVQTILPKQVIIVEQNPDENSTSELDFLKTESWPFTIKHHFIHQAGACNARNLALSEVTSEWVILGDDDNRFEKDLIEKFINTVNQYGIKAVSSVYLEPNEKQTFHITSQSSIFGSGNSIIKTSMLKQISFDMAYEFGYAEDKDFGMQIRNIGEDVLFDSKTHITHLRAPIGGFRKPVVKKWDDETVQPKPSPTIMLYNLKYLTKEQLLGFKFSLFIKYYKKQSIKNPFAYYKKFKQQWNVSVKWAKYLNNA